MDRIVTVEKFSGQSYGYRGEIRFTLHDYAGVALFTKGRDSKHGNYHFDEYDINQLHEKYPDYIPKPKDEYYKGRVTDWGYDVEEGLCKLMMEEKLILNRTVKGKGYTVSFKWYGEKWNPEHRKIKRFLPKNPNLKI